MHDVHVSKYQAYFRLTLRRQSVLLCRGQRLLPAELAARLTIIIELACLIFLVLGARARITAIILIGLSALVDPTYQRSIDLAYYLMVLGLIALHGPGALSIDSLLVRALERRFPGLKGMSMVSYEGMPHVVIVGGGFGGIAAARALRRASCWVTVIDRRNYFYSSRCSTRQPPPGFLRPTSPDPSVLGFAISPMFV